MLNEIKFIELKKIYMYNGSLLWLIIEVSNMTNLQRWALPRMAHAGIYFSVVLEQCWMVHQLDR
jgi:hypothetical protein